MKVAGLRVDGYGRLADLEIGPLPEGLSVILGPNEAGKSTLLDFLRGVLFGFPDRRHRSPFHEPLRGGRHGGAVRLLDSHGTHWTLERHLDRRQPVLSGPDGQVADPALLGELLGGADDALFRSIFAFGLGELASFESLERDEVREVVFSAGVLGAGRSATQAMRAIDRQRDALVRPRQQDARATQLRRRLDELDGALRQARAAASAYTVAANESERLRSAARAARGEAEGLHRRARELERLESCWAPWRRRRDAAAALSALGELPADTHCFVLSALEIRALGEQLSGHEERRGTAERLEGQLAGIERSLRVRLKDLGYDPEGRTLPALDIGLEDEVATLARRQRESSAACQVLDSELEAARHDLEAARRDYERAGGEAAHDPARTAARLSDSQQLRSLVGTLDRLESEQAARHHASTLAALTTPSTTSPLGARLFVAALFLVAFGLLFIALSGAHHDPALAAAAFAAFLAAIAVQLRSGRKIAPAASARDQDLEFDTRINRVRTSVATLATSLGLAPRPEGEEVSALVASIEAERDKQRELDELTRAVAHATERAEALGLRRGALGRELSAINGAVGRIAEKLELAPDLGAEALQRAIEGLRAAEELVAASARVAPELAAVRAATGSFDAQINGLFARLGMAARQPSGVAEAVGMLAAELDRALGEESRRTLLANEVAAGDRLLEEALGEGADAERLRRELAGGTLDAWAEERRAVTDRLEASNARYEEALAAQLDAERALAALASSEEIASLAQEREQVAAELGETLGRWLSLGLSTTLLQRTLARYESERQPLVISRAGALFSAVTAGAYEKLVAREDADQRHHGIEAITPSGQRVDAADLSRGTAEQLYLCLRLAFAATFAERAVALPLVLDDVLVNFDPERAAAMTRAIAKVAEEHQVIVFTCHPHLAEGFARESPTAELIALGRA